jgi:hypothetical protein
VLENVRSVPILPHFAKTTIGCAIEIGSLSLATLAAHCGFLLSKALEA